MLARKATGLIFDLDGTLIQSAQAITAVANDFLATLTLASVTSTETISFIGGGSEQFVQLLLESRHAYDASLFAEHFARFSEIYLAAPPDLNTPFPGVESALRALAAKGHPLAICTNKPAAPTNRIIEALGWSKLFMAIVAGDTIASKKPDPAPLYEAAARIGCQTLFYIGDSEVDAETAQRANQPFVLFSQGYRKTAVTEIPHAANFPDYDELDAIVETLLTKRS